jgi:hypothetical protein
MEELVRPYDHVAVPLKPRAGEAVEVELADEGAVIVMFEVLWKVFLGE